LRRLAWVLAMAVLAATAGVIAKQSIDYHPTYVERIETWIEAQRRAALKRDDHEAPSDPSEQPEPKEVTPHAEVPEARDQPQAQP
jgi:hypothetical protein